jgi:hypothetical protein
LKSLTLDFPAEEIERRKKELQENKMNYRKFRELTGGIF